MKKFKIRHITAIFFTSIALTAGASTAAVAGTVHIVGWPAPNLSGETPAIELGDDPIYGRQMCPPLTRLNLDERRSEDLLVKGVRQESVGGQTVWTFDIRTGLYWWRGEQVTSDDLAKFLRAELGPVVSIRSGQIWDAGSFDVNPSGPQTVKVQFKQKPAFGPYILNGVPFFRPIAAGAEGFKYECVGLYRPQAAAWGVALAPTPGYKSQRAMPELAIYASGQVPSAKSSNAFYVRFAGAVNSSPAVRPPDASYSCAHTLELPNLLMIVWDKRSSLGGTAEFRRAISQLMPRSALASSGAAALAEIANSPIPKNHPGYDAKLPPQGFDLRAASAALNKLGLKRASSTSPRLDERGEPIKLTFLTQSNQAGLAEKVILDSLSAVGIAVDFKTQIAAGEKVDGMLANFAVDWPRVSYLPYFHSGAKLEWPVQPVTDKNLDRDLEKYAVSITYQKPDWNLMSAVQRDFADLEGVTVLLQQKACIDNPANFKLAKGSISQRNPDWFRQLLF
ncbi:MAG: Bacterial extracellular solute-binding protein family 5 Middle [Pseudomonadota bacterium]